MVSYTYELTAAATPGIYTITGTLGDFSRVDHPVVGDSQITVAVPPGVTVSPTDLTIDEGGSGTYTVELNTQPTSDVTVTVNDPAGKTDVTAESASLTFTTSNWGTSQTVTVSAAEDDDASRDTATVTHIVSGGDYASFAASSVAVTVTDNDTPGVTVTPMSLTVNEGGTGRYTVRLNTLPTSNVLVAISSNNTDVTVPSSTLTFTTTVLGNREDGPVVDLQDVSPCGQRLLLGVGDRRAAHQRQGLDRWMHAGNPLVKHQGVGDDGASHAAGLGNVGHSQEAGYCHRDAGTGLVQLIQELCGPFDALFQPVGGLVYGALRDGHQADHVGQVLNRALQPAGLREALYALRALGEDAVVEARRREGGGQVVGLAYRVGVAEGDGGFDDAPVGGKFQPKAGLCLGLGGDGGQVLGFDHNGRATGGGDDDVGAPPGVPGDGLCALGLHVAPGQHALKQAAQGVVDVWLSLTWHTSQSAYVQPSFSIPTGLTDC